MTDTATSPRFQHHHHRSSHTHSRSSRQPTTTPAARPPNIHPGSVGQTMPPLLSTPHNRPTTSVKTPSPNYFGFQGEDVSFLNDSPQHAKSNWSPPSSTVRSTAAASPSLLPLDQNPEFDAFRRQSEGKAFNLGGLSGGFGMSMPGAGSGVPSAASRTDGGAGRPGTGHHRRTSSKAEHLKEAAQAAHRKSLDPSTAEYGRSPKRVLSPGSSILPEEARRASPASFAHSEDERATKNATLDSQPRFALPLDSLPGSAVSSKPRAETLPVPSGAETLMVTSQHVVNLLESRLEQVLLLDLRVQTQYAKSHINGALNLCIPTTLLKRPSFNVQKLAEAFKDEEQRRKFEKWRSCSYIIVYDGSSALLKDATICVNTIKKFKSEGYEGTLYIVKGGFAEFSRRFSGYVEAAMDSETSDSSRTGVDGEGPEVAPVMGGCPMPSTDKPANPFFGNIRQNMDLIGGVGQIPLKHPNRGTKSAEREFPEWLRLASEDKDQGKKVASKFESIEKREKKRMEDALSGKVTWGTPRKQTPSNPAVQIAGLEKGNKNRYNNIWPFEHSRVKLQGVSRDGCDYVNASFVKAAWTEKSYISTQAPIPATFNDFWNVVWQQDVRVIVMLTAEKEGPQVKAHNYWGQKQYGPLHLDFLSEKRASIEPSRIHRHRQSSTHHSSQSKQTSSSRPSMQKRTSTGPQIPHTQLDGSEEKVSEEPYVVVRRFTLSHERFPFEPMREITQLQYANWPDFGAPAHPAHLLGLVEQCDAVVRAAGKSLGGTSGNQGVGEVKRPVLVHCSAGCGRTGTFCTVDSVIDMLKRQRKSRKAQGRGGAGSRGASPMDLDSSPPAQSSSSARSPGARKGMDTTQPLDGFFGTHITKDAVVASAQDHTNGDWLSRDDLDLVEKTVEDFRHQRLSMVQSLRQYVLCYESVMEWIVEQHGEKNSSS